jgi:hypothetical protein
MCTPVGMVHDVINGSGVEQEQAERHSNKQRGTATSREGHTSNKTTTKEKKQQQWAFKG